MGTGLKDQWGVADPAKPGSDVQSSQFKAAMERDLGIVNGHLQYTVTNAEAVKHEPLAKRRDALIPQYQQALKAIDPANPAKAKPSIDKVQAAMRNLLADADKLHAAAEAALTQWKKQQPDLDAAVHKIEELEDWGEPRAATLRAVCEALRKQVDARQYSPASAALDKFLPKLAPLYDEYTKQKAAKEAYEPALAAVQQRLADAQVSRYKKLEAAQAELGTLQKEMQAAVAKKDYVLAQARLADLTRKVDACGKSMQDLDAQKKACDAAVAAVRPRAAKVAAAAASKKLAAMRDEVAKAMTQVDAGIAAEDFEVACKQAADLVPRIDAYDKAEGEQAQAKKEYDEAAAPLPALVTRVSDAGSTRLAATKAEILKANGEMQTAAKDEDYARARDLARTLRPKLDGFVTELDNLARQRKAYEDALAPLLPRLGAGPGANAQLDAMLRDIHAVRQDMEAAAHAEDYARATAQVKSLPPRLDAYDAAVRDLEAQRVAYEAELKLLQPRLGALKKDDKALAAEVKAQQGRIESSAASRNYVEALKLAKALGAQLDAAKAEADKKAAAGPGGEGQAQGEGAGPVLAPVEFSLPVKAPETDLGYVTAGGSVSFAIKCQLGEEQSGNVEVAGKLKGLAPEIELAVKQKYGGVTLVSSAAVSEKEVAGGLSLEHVDGATNIKTTFAFVLVKIDPKTCEAKVMSAEWSETFPIKSGEVTVKGIRLKLSGSVKIKVTAQPAWKKIGIALAKRYGIAVAEDAALGVTAGGTGTAGAAAVAAAASPAIVVAGGIVGGLAVTAGAMAWLEALEAAGRDAMDVCKQGSRALRAYAESYGSTMRGASGTDANGRRDAEAALKVIMDKAPGTTREQAIDAARQSKQNFENLAYRALLPKMRESVKAAYDKKHPWTPDNTLMIVMNDELSLSGHY
jgi:hypothetical protein